VNDIKVAIILRQRFRTGEVLTKKNYIYSGHFGPAWPSTGEKHQLSIPETEFKKWKKKKKFTNGDTVELLELLSVDDGTCLTKLPRCSKK
jgi:hypothetical protein